MIYEATSTAPYRHRALRMVYPNGRMVSFRVRGATIAEALSPKLKLFTLAKTLGSVEIFSELPVRMTHASIPPTEREGLGVEKIDLVEGRVRWAGGRR